MKGGRARNRLERAMRSLLELAGVVVAERDWQVSGRRVHALEVAGARPLLLIHGASGGAANWYRLFGGLAGDFRVLAPDLPGFGFSDPVRLGSRLARETAAWLMEWLEAAGWPGGDVVGTSFGGQVALQLAALAPERVERLVVLNATGLGREISWLARLAAVPGLRRHAATTSRAGTAWLLRHLLMTDRSSLSAEEERRLVEYLHAASAVSAAVMRSAYGLVVGVGGQRDLLEDAELAGIRAPTLVVWGAADPFLPPAHGQRAAARMTTACFTPLEGVGHSPNWERPDLVLDRLRGFLLGARRTA